MLTKVKINADAIDVSSEGNKLDVIKRPVCFHAVRQGAFVHYRKIEESGEVDMSKKGRKVPLASFMASFMSFNDHNNFEVDETFKQDTFLFTGPLGVKVVAAMEMPADFYITCQESGEIINFEKGDVLITNEMGINLAMSKEEYESAYLSQNELHQIVKPDITIVRSLENDSGTLSL